MKCQSVKNSQSTRYAKMVTENKVATYVCRDCKRAERLAKKAQKVEPGIQGLAVAIPPTDAPVTPSVVPPAPENPIA